MAVSTDVGLALLLCGTLLGVNAVIRGYCARHIPLDMVPAVLRGRVQFCNRLTPTMLFVAGAMVASGAVLSVILG